MTKEIHETVDWSVQDRRPEPLCFCGCGGQYRSHANLFRTGSGRKIVTRKGCPDCGSHDNVVSTQMEKQ